jgi:hypothetical protein
MAALRLTPTTTLLPIAIWIWGAAALAQPAPAVPDGDVTPPPEDPRLTRAKELFRQGVALMEADAYERALGYFIESRAAYESSKNTTNAAICLDKLGRFDEALEMYEILVAKFADDLDEEDRASIGPSMAALREKTGTLALSSNVDGLVVIDGRARGSLPLPNGFVRLTPGTHRVRVVKGEYETFEGEVEIAIGQVANLDAKLAPLHVAGGRLRVESPELADGEVYVDGLLVGRTPWESTLTTGDHTWFVRKGDLGTAPSGIIIVKGQTTLATAKPEPLGALLHVRIEPRTAEISIGGTPVGTGQWDGRLPLGAPTIEAREAGYVAKSQSVAIADGAPSTITWRLEVQEDHPRWGVKRAGRFTIEAFGGPAFGPTLASGAEATCGANVCGSDPAAIGFLAGVRLGYEFSFRLSIDVGGGFLLASKGLGRTLDESFELTPKVDGAPVVVVPTRYALVDSLGLYGPFAALGLGYRVPLYEDVLELRAHASIGPVYVRSRQETAGAASAGGAPVGLIPVGSAAAIPSANLLILPELELGLRFGRVSVGAGIGVAILALPGPENLLDALQPGKPCDPDVPTNIRCAPQEGFIDTERTHGPFALVLPDVSVGYSF